MIQVALQQKMAARALANWKGDSELRKKFNGEITAYIDEHYDNILENIWNVDTEMRATFFNYEGFRAYALAEFEKRKPLADGKKSILI